MGVFIIVDIVMSAALLLGGCRMSKATPEDRENGIGFRTSLSTSSDEAWMFANELCGRYLIDIGAVGIIASIALPLVLNMAVSETAGMIGAIAVLVIVTLAVNMAIMNTYQRLNSRFGKGDDRNDSDNL